MYNTLYFADIAQLNSAITMYHVQSENVPKRINNMFINVSSIHNYNTRQCK